MDLDFLQDIKRINMGHAEQAFSLLNFSNVLRKVDALFPVEYLSQSV